MLDLNLLSDIREARKQGFTLEDILVSIALSNSGITTSAVTPLSVNTTRAVAGNSEKVAVKPRKTRKTHKARTVVTNTQSRQIRAWAVENGFAEAANVRGRLSLAVHEAYKRAHSE